MKAISKSYWRLIKNGVKQFQDIPDSVKEDVIILARQEVEEGKITAEKYQDLIGVPYQE